MQQAYARASAALIVGDRVAAASLTQALIEEFDRLDIAVAGSAHMDDR